MHQDSPEPGATGVTLRPRLWRRPELLALIVSVPFGLGTWWHEPDSGSLWVLLVVVALLTAARWPGRLWLVITDADVSCSHRLARGTDARRVLREGIRAVDVWRNRVVFSGENGDAVLSLRPCWTAAQCGEMAAHLGVPLVRHRGRTGR